MVSSKDSKNAFWKFKKSCWHISCFLSPPSGFSLGLLESELDSLGIWKEHLNKMSRVWKGKCCHQTNPCLWTYTEKPQKTKQLIQAGIEIQVNQEKRYHLWQPMGDCGHGDLPAHHPPKVQSESLVTANLARTLVKYVCVCVCTARPSLSES